MSSTFFIDWTSHRIFKVNTRNFGLSVSEYGHAAESDKLNHYRFKLTTNFSTEVTTFFDQSTIQCVNPNSIYTHNKKVYCFQNGDLQYGSKGTRFYMMDELKENIFSCGNKFVQLEDQEMFVISISRVNEFYAKLDDYYPTSELLYLHAKNVLKLENWKQNYNRILYLKTSPNLATAECWVNVNQTSVFLENTVSKFYYEVFLRNIVDFFTL